MCHASIYSFAILDSFHLSRWDSWQNLHVHLLAAWLQHILLSHLKAIPVLSVHKYRVCSGELDQSWQELKILLSIEGQFFQRHISFVSSLGTHYVFPRPVNHFQIKTGSRSLLLRIIIAINEFLRNDHSRLLYWRKSFLHSLLISRDLGFQYSVFYWILSCVRHYLLE